MKTTLFRVAGAAVDPEAIAQVLCTMTDPSQLEHRSIENTHIILAQRFYWRTCSNLLTVGIVVPSSETACEIEIISGGGGDGLGDWTWWSESKELKRAREKLNALAAERSWTIEQIAQT